MIKTRWVRNAAVFGTAVTLSLACVSTVSESSAASFCQETEMAGLSLSLDKFYTENYADTKESDNNITTVGAITEPVANGSPATSAASAATVASMAEVSASPSAVPSDEDKKTEEERKEERVARQFRDLGISTASNYVNIRKKPTTDSEVLGKLYKGHSAKIIGEKKGWVKIESGSVTGYIRKDLLAIGAKAEKLAGKYGTAIAKVKKGVTLNVRAKKSTKSTILTQIPEEEQYEIIGESDNWYRIALDDGTKGYVAKEFVNTHVHFQKAISIEEEQEEIRRRQEAERAEQERLAALAAEQEAESAGSPSTTEEEGSNYISGPGSSDDSESQDDSNANNSDSSENSGNPEDSDSSEASDSSSDSDGSESSEDSISSSDSDGTENSEDSESSNSSSGSSSEDSGNSEGTPVQEGSSGSAVASYACKFVGNPYVWGGTSLTKGADCSGFVMSVYAQFGYSLPHSSAAQAGCGRPVSLSKLQPGDLLFYRNGGRIGHVTMYIGGGRVVHASTRKDGIKISNYNYRQPACARRIIG